MLYLLSFIAFCLLLATVLILCVLHFALVSSFYYYYDIIKMTMPIILIIIINNNKLKPEQIDQPDTFTKLNYIQLVFKTNKITFQSHWMIISTVSPFIVTLNHLRICFSQECQTILCSSFSNVRC